MEGLNYSVKMPVFEGPLDLLLDLIEKRKLFINDISLSQVTDGFISYIESHEEFPIEDTAEFIVVASTLMLIKSRSLLPSLPLTQEEEASIEDLEARLSIYARIKELAQEVKKLYGKEIIFEKSPSRREVVIFSPDSKTDIHNIQEALGRVINALPKKEKLAQATVRKIMSLEEMITKLTERMTGGSRMRFSDFAGKDKHSVIIGFLAMLELVKRGAIRVNQEEGRHNEIEMESESIGVPRYV